jgi:polyisoprenyl-phosphate glycosyltransferase
VPARDRIAIVMPVLDDWISFGMVVQAIAQRFSSTGRRFVVLAVDDGSTLHPSSDGMILPHGSCIEAIEVLQLAINLGHQRAIAVGLALAARRHDVATVIVMDSDGEDRPDDIATLLTAADECPDHVVLAQRTRRTEGIVFRIGYVIYKILFRVLTGRMIDFGNFCLLPMSVVRRLVHMPDLWNNLAASIMRSRLQRISVPTVRGVRHAGRSHMNLLALVLHGLSAMSVYADEIFVRVLLGTALAAAVTVLGGLIVVIIRFGTSFGVPGWASTMIGDLFIILMQTIVIAVATTLMVLGNRSQRPIVPFADAPSFVVHREQMTTEDASHGAAT